MPISYLQDLCQVRNDQTRDYLRIWDAVLSPGFEMTPFSRLCSIMGDTVQAASSRIFIVGAAFSRTFFYNTRQDAVSSAPVRIACQIGESPIQGYVKPCS
jgi:hypothetical protein